MKLLTPPMNLFWVGKVIETPKFWHNVVAHTSFGVCKKKRKEKIENLTCTNVFGKLYTIPMVSKEVQENRMESLEGLESRIPLEVDLYSRRENH